MALTNEQYNQIMHVYDERRARRDAILRDRVRDVYAKVPEYREAEVTLHRAAVNEVRRRIYSDVSGETLDADALHHLSDRKRTLLTQAGYEADYLEIPYTCPDCQDTGYVNGQRCHCFNQLINDLLYTNHASSESATFDDFSLSYYSDTFIDEKTSQSARECAKKALSEAKRFCVHFGESFDNLLLYGKPGTGKTLLSRCIETALKADGHTVAYLSAFELFSIMKKETFSRSIYPNTAFLRLFSSDLLIIDDLGTEFANSMTSSQLFELLNERILQSKATLISTNLDLAGFSELYTERLFSRVMEFYTLLPLIGEDIRILHKLNRVK